MKNYNDINISLNEVMKKYDTVGKGPFKDETGFTYLKNKEKGLVKYIKDYMNKENEKNKLNLNNNIKIAQADINDMNNMKRVANEKERINNEKIKRLENDNTQLDNEIVELKEILDKKRNILKNMKKRNQQAINNRKKLNEMNNNNNRNNISNDIVLNQSNDDIGKQNVQNNINNSGQNTYKKKQKESGCECIII